MVEYFPANGYKLKRPFWSPGQKRAFDRFCDQENAALFHAPRCGKSDIICTTACYQFSLGKLNGLVIIAYPSAAHYGWIRDIFPEAATVPWRGLSWGRSESKTQGWQKDFEKLLRYSGLAVLTMNVEALITVRAKEVLSKFCRARNLIMVINDESTSTVNPDARRTKTMLSLGSLPPVKFRRILDGTPVDAKGPLDLYSQIGFLDFSILGYPNFTEFKAHYAQMQINGKELFWAEVRRLQTLAEGRGYADPKGWAIRSAQGALIKDGAKKRRLRPGQDYWETIAKENGKPIFKNMDELQKRLAPYIDRYTFEEAFPNAERQIFVKRYVELSDEQRRVYKAIEEEYQAMLHDGTIIDARHHLARTLRLQQVTSNYYPDRKLLSLHEPCGGLGCEGCGDQGVIEALHPLKLIDPINSPKMAALEAELSEDVPTIIWARFRQDVDQVIECAKNMGRKICRFDGAVSNKDKIEAREGFQAGRYDSIVGNWAAMSRGIPLHRAGKHVNMSSSWSFRMRKQGEERSEHGSKKVATVFTDIVALDTVDDQKIIPALRAGMDVSDFVLQDQKRDWI